MPPTKISVLVGMTVKPAVTDLATVIETTHAPVPLQAPDHPVNAALSAGAAVNVTDVPGSYDSEQSGPQLMPAGVLSTVPAPFPVFVTVSV